MLPYCGGPLHYANYSRKPRGGPRFLAEAFEIRLSLCCGRDGCRRRVLPPSVRFWERRVYWAPAVLVVTALRQGRGPEATLARLKALCGAWRSTIDRWLGYFRDLFPKSPFWLRLSGRLMPPIRPDALPGALLERFCRPDRQAEAALAGCLQALARGP